jgi:Domain of unknown function (DUF4864)
MRALALVLGILVTASPAAAADRIVPVLQVDPEAKIEKMAVPVRSIIEQQMIAVRQANAAAAFASVAPKLQQTFATGENYLRFFRAQFPGIASGHIISFGDLRETSFGMAQMVRISGERGEPWLALFIMDEVDNGDWRIANVVVVKVPSVEI